MIKHGDLTYLTIISWLKNDQEWWFMHKWVISPPENTNLTIEKQTTYENSEIHHQETGF